MDYYLKQTNSNLGPHSFVLYQYDLGSVSIKYVGNFRAMLYTCDFKLVHYFMFLVHALGFMLSPGFVTCTCYMYL